MVISKYGYKRDYKGCWQKKIISELKNSCHYIIIRCDECRKIFKSTWSNRQIRVIKKQNKLDLCSSCSKIGNRNSQYKKDRKNILKYARSFQKHNGMKGKNHSDETKEQMSLCKANLIATGNFNILSNNHGIKSWYFSTKMNEWFYSDSLLERLRMIQLDNNSIITAWTKNHEIKIPYSFNGINRYCVPDFLITYSDGHKAIEEVKGRIIKKEIVKKDAIKIWCRRNNVSFDFVTQKQLNENGEYRLFLRQYKERE